MGAEVSPLRHWIGGPASHFAEAGRAKTPRGPGGRITPTPAPTIHLWRQKSKTGSNAA